MKFNPLYWFVMFLILATSVATGFYVQYREDVLQEHTDYSVLLLTLKEAEVLMGREVLKVISFQQNQYDVLVDAGNRLQLLSEDLKKLAMLPNGTGGPFLKHDIGNYEQHLINKLALIERIKSRAGMIRNSLHYLPLLVSRYDQQAERLAFKLATLLNQIYRYNLFPGKIELKSLEQQIVAMKAEDGASAEQQQMLEDIRLHMLASLGHMRILGDLTTQLAEATGGSHFESLYAAIERYRQQDMQVFSQFGLLMLIMVCVLALAVSVLLRRLSSARHAAEQSWNRLSDGVNSLSEAFALFDREGRLVLANQTWEHFYPWLKGKMHASISLQEIDMLNANHVAHNTLSGRELDAESFTDFDKPYFLERVDKIRWYLASDSKTKEGGMVCVRSDFSELKEKELQLRKMGRALEQSPASVVITNTEGIIEYVNPKFEEVSGYSAEEALGQNPRILKGGDKSSEDYATLWDTLKQGKVWRGSFHNKKKDGSIYWESASISPIRDDQGQITHYIGVKEDVTARKRAEEQLRMNATVFETTTEGIMVTDAEARIKTVNPAFTEITGYSAEEAIGQMPSMFSSGRHDQTFFDEMWNHLRTVGNWAGEIWNRRKDGSVFPEWLSIAAIKDEKGAIDEYVAIFSDITQRKQNEEQILYQANYDVLTGLPNRTLLFDRLLQSIVSCRREKWKFALMFVDLDRFKAVNDLHGHVIGDELLQLVAGRLKSAVREVDTVARFGGDEFVVLLHGIHGEDDAALVSQKLIKSLSEPFEVVDRSVSIGATIGITLFPADASEGDSLIDIANALLSNADMAMYQAKSKGRNRYQFFQRSMQARVKDHLALEQDLGRALENNELLVYYQPIHEAYGGELVGVEALIRWQHPQRGMVMPDTFIGLAEETGLIGPIGEWVFQTACKQTSEWRAKEIIGLNLSVNLSTRQRNLGFTADKLASILQDTGLPAEYLLLEITENLLMEESARSVQWLTEFRGLGVRLAIDDFGTGYSSLSYLKRFPVNTLKIDRSFVHDLPDNKEDASLVAAIVAMADSLGIEVVAEGVETDAQRKFINKVGCDYMQGYLFGKPMPPEEILARYGSGFDKPLT